MLIQLAIASFMVMITVLIHLVGLAIIIRVVRSERPLFRRLRFSPLTVLLGATVGVFAIHSIEIWLYAALYLALGALGHFEEALYFSTVTYASVGYGDVLMPHAWRISRRDRGSDRNHHARMVDRVSGVAAESTEDLWT